jgi:hypothetical protein
MVGQEKFSPSSFGTVVESGIRDPGSRMDKNQDPVSGINIPDPQHCFVKWQTRREAEL